MVNVLFVCLGNICRSPMAEGVFGHLVQEAGLEGQIAVDSVGTGGWHVGERPHRGTQQVLRKNGIAYHGRARQISLRDMADQKTWIIAMDNSNVQDVRGQFGDHPRLHKLLDFATEHPQERNVPDPYYTGGFDYVYELVLDGCRGLLATIRQEEGV